MDSGICRNDGRRRLISIIVTPVKAGVQYSCKGKWIPADAGMTGGEGSSQLSSPRRDPQGKDCSIQSFCISSSCSRHPASRDTCASMYIVPGGHAGMTRVSSAFLYRHPGATHRDVGRKSRVGNNGRNAGVQYSMKVVIISLPGSG